MKATNCEHVSSAADFLPRTKKLPALRRAAAHCHGCDLYCDATQTVFGLGPASASMVMVGEQPGDQEDLAGKPFVGPSGHLLDEAMEEAGIDRTQVYVTNAVKHFRFTMRGKRRLHVKPSARQITACRPWLEAELAAVEPKVVVCLGATAAQSLLGRDFRVTREHGKAMTGTDWAPAVVATVHPSAVLRTPDEAGRRQLRRQLIDDLAVAAAALGRGGNAG
jgi:DNA polymerase